MVTMKKILRYLLMVFITALLIACGDSGQGSAGGESSAGKVFGALPLPMADAATGDGVWNYSVASDYYYGFIKSGSQPSLLADFNSNNKLAGKMTYVFPVFGYIDKDVNNSYSSNTAQTNCYIGTSTPIPHPPIPPVCQDILCAYDYSSAYPSENGSYKKFFPGTQYATDPKAGPVIPVVGANIYQCALSSGSSSFGCNSEYVSNVDTLKPNYVQVMQAINYVWTTISKLTPTAAYYGTTPGASLSGNVVYLFSTQYAGPVQSYSDFNKLQPPISSHTLCTDPTTPSAQQCSYLASAYNSSASCGDENSFGTWGAYFSDFKLFQALFFTTQGGTACPGASCSAGIYMYDYIPQA